jgi:hypothetical protein
MVVDQYEARKKAQENGGKKAPISSTLHHLFNKTSSRFLLYRKLFLKKEGKSNHC